MLHKTIVIKGWVQGVGFRYAARKTAVQYGISGFVKNLPDGSVYIEAEGSETAVEEFLSWCHKGPLRAQIHSVTITEGPIQGCKDFIIAF
jgi:acylphosphatase